MTLSLALIGLAGCSTGGPKAAQMYDGPPLAASDVALLRTTTRRDLVGVQTIIERLDGKDMPDDNYWHQAATVLPGEHIATVFADDVNLQAAAVARIIAQTGVETLPAQPNTLNLMYSFSLPDYPKPIKVNVSDPRCKTERDRMQRETRREVEFFAEAGKKYIVRCTLDTNNALTGRGIWIEPDGQ